MSFIEHIPSYFNDFGESVMLGGVTKTVIVDMPTRDAMDMTARDVDLVLPTSDAAGVVAGTTAVVRGTAYRVRVVDDDGTGITYLRLTKP